MHLMVAIRALTSQLIVKFGTSDHPLRPCEDMKNVEQLVQQHPHSTKSAPNIEGAILTI